MPTNTDRPAGSSRQTAVLQLIGRSLLISPVILSLLLAASIVSIGQFAEVFVSAATSPEPWRLVIGFLAFALFAASMFFGYLSSWVVMRQRGVGYGSRLIYQSVSELRADRWIVRARNMTASACAILPLLAVSVSLYRSSLDIERKSEALGRALDLAGLPSLAVAQELITTPEQLQTVAAGWAIASILLLPLLFLYGRVETALPLRRILSHPRAAIAIASPVLRPRLMTRIPRPIWVLSLAALIAPPVLLNSAPAWLDIAAKSIGPMANIALVLLTIATGLFVIGNLSRKTGFPIILLFIVTVLAFGIGRWLTAEISHHARTAPLRSPDTDDPTRSIKLEAQFRQWIASRPDRQRFVERGKRYPVFIVAAQGGGIYAASAAASFLAKLQDHCDNFSQHVFAISAVSGGAIGSALFHGLSRQAKPTDRAACNEAAAAGRYRREVTRIIRADHLSPTVAATIPDALYKLLQVMWWDTANLLETFGLGKVPRMYDMNGRAEALECSFLRASATAGDATDCKRPDPRDRKATPSHRLTEWFDKTWRPSDATPALVLNTTWAETGDRLAFSPFEFDKIASDATSDVSLRRFDPDATLIEAAVASARFPAMMPAKILRPSFGGSRERWWNLVDGGYADASGATTALDLYLNLLPVVGELHRQNGLDIDLRLVIITDPTSSLNETGVTGDGLIHAISPITTLLNVRSLIARQAVLRAEARILELDRKQPEDRIRRPWRSSCENHDWRVRRIELDQDSFHLPLGWMISEQTDEFVNQLIGSPTRFDRIPLSGWPDPQRIAYRLYDNSCTMYSIAEVLSLKGPDARKRTPAP